MFLRFQRYTYLNFDKNGDRTLIARYGPNCLFDPIVKCCIRLSTNFMTFIPSLTFTELWVVSMEHLQRVWLASRERLPFQTPGSVPIFGTCLCSNCWDQMPRTCHVFTRLFTLNTPWYFLDFAFRRSHILYYTTFILPIAVCNSYLRYSFNNIKFACE